MSDSGNGKIVRLRSGCSDRKGRENRLAKLQARKRKFRNAVDDDNILPGNIRNMAYDDEYGIEDDLTSSRLNLTSSKDVKSPQLSSRGQHIKEVRTGRLMKEFGALTHISESSANPIFSVALIDDCLYEWEIKLYRVDPDSLLNRDMVEYGVPFILLNMSFPENFPFQPPFLRVISPKMEKGYVMGGGSICMELLTPKGWAPAYTVEAVIMQFAASLAKGKGRIIRNSTKEYNKEIAESSFRSLVKIHDKYGWTTPPLSEG